MPEEVNNWGFNEQCRIASATAQHQCSLDAVQRWSYLPKSAMREQSVVGSRKGEPKHGCKRRHLCGRTPNFVREDNADATRGPTLPAVDIHRVNDTLEPTLASDTVLVSDIIQFYLCVGAVPDIGRTPMTLVPPRVATVLSASGRPTPATGWSRSSSVGETISA